MNILMVSDFFLPRLGGVERVILEVGKRLVERGHSVSVLTPRLDRAWPREEIIQGLHVVRFDVTPRHVLIYPTTIWGGYKAFNRMIGEERFDLIHFHLPLSSIGVRLSAHSKSVPQLFTFYGPWHEEMRFELMAKPLPFLHRKLYHMYVLMLCQLLRRLQRTSLLKSDKVFVLSECSRAQLRELVPEVSPSDVALIPGGVDVDRFRPAGDRAGARRQLGLPADATVLLTVRRLVPRMGLENLVRAVALIRQQRPEIICVVGGTGRLAGQLRRLCGELGLDSAVSFAGLIPENLLPLYYQAADVFVLPTIALEGFGLITLEALACGLPVVATPVGANPGVLGKLDPSMLTQDVTPDALASAITGLLNRIARTDNLREQCRRYAVENYSWDTTVDKYEKLYLDLVDARGRR